MKRRIVTGTDGIPVYVTVDGDMVDLIAFEYYGRHAQNTEEILNANPGLAAYGPVLPAGRAIKLPRINQQNTPVAFKKLWD